MKNKIYRITDNTEECYCRRCKEFHDCEEFGYDSRTEHGYSMTCEATMVQRMGVNANYSQRKFNRESANLILTRLGYNLKSTIPIHEQFLIKHEL